MADTSDRAHDAGGAAQRPDVGEKQKQGAGETGAGQEATHHAETGEHDREHQSNYGGGGVNGGTSSSGKA